MVLWTRSDECKSGIFCSVCNDRAIHDLLHQRDVSEGADSADALEEGAAGDQPRVVVVDQQGLVHIVRHVQLHLIRNKIVKEHI